MLATLAPYIVVLFTITLAALAALTMTHVVERLDSLDYGPSTNESGHRD
jgi:hypothetical protein